MYVLISPHVDFENALKHTCAVSFFAQLWNYCGVRAKLPRHSVARNDSMCQPHADCALCGWRFAVYSSGNMFEFVGQDRAQSLVGAEHDMLTFCFNLSNEKLLVTRHVACIFRRNASNFCGDADSLCFYATSCLLEYNSAYPHFAKSLRAHIYPTCGVSVCHLLYLHYCTDYTSHMFHLWRRHLLHPTRKPDYQSPVHGMPLRLWTS